MLRFQNRICIQQETTMETGGLEEVPSNLSWVQEYEWETRAQCPRQQDQLSLL